MTTPIDTGAAIKRIEKTILFWKRLYRLWWAIHYFIGVIGVACAVLASSAGMKEDMTSKYLWLVGLIGAVSTALVTFLGPVQKAERYWRGFHIAEQALLDFESGQSDIKKVARELKLARRVVLIGVEPSNSDEHGKDAHPLT